MIEKEQRGFASMDRAKQREIASKGGKAAHRKGTAHQWTPDEARKAGKKGGQNNRGRNTYVTSADADAPRESGSAAFDAATPQQRQTAVAAAARIIDEAYGHKE